MFLFSSLDHTIYHSNDSFYNNNLLFVICHPNPIEPILQFGSKFYFTSNFIMKCTQVIAASFISTSLAQRVQQDPGVSADLHDMISGLGTEDLLASDREYLQELRMNYVVHQFF